MAEFIAKKREMFLVQMSLDTKREEIRKLEEKARMKEEALRKSEQARKKRETRDSVPLRCPPNGCAIAHLSFAAFLSGAGSSRFVPLLRVVFACLFLVLAAARVPRLCTRVVEVPGSFLTTMSRTDQKSPADFKLTWTAT